MNVKEQREILGMTQGALAAELGVDRSTVTKWEQNPATVPVMAVKWIEQMVVAKKSPPAPTVPAQHVPVSTGILTVREQAKLKYKDREWLTHTEAHEYLGMDRKTLYNRVQEGAIPQPVEKVMRVGPQNRWAKMYRREWLDAYEEVESQRVGRRFSQKGGLK